MISFRRKIANIQEIMDASTTQFLQSIYVDYLFTVSSGKNMSHQLKSYDCRLEGMAVLVVECTLFRQVRAKNTHKNETKSYFVQLLVSCLCETAPRRLLTLRTLEGDNIPPKGNIEDRNGQIK